MIDRNTRNQLIVCKLFVLDKNTWYICGQTNDYWQTKMLIPKM